MLTSYSVENFRNARVKVPRLEVVRGGDETVGRGTLGGGGGRRGGRLLPVEGLLPVETVPVDGVPEPVGGCLLAGRHRYRTVRREADQQPALLAEDGHLGQVDGVAAGEADRLRLVAVAQLQLAPIEDGPLLLRPVARLHLAAPLDQHVHLDSVRQLLGALLCGKVRQLHALVAGALLQAGRQPADYCNLKINRWMGEEGAHLLSSGAH